MDRQSDRLPRQTRCEGMRIKREIQMGASGGGQSIKASGIGARIGRTQTCNRHDSPKPKTPLTRGARPHNSPPAESQQQTGRQRSALYFTTVPDAAVDDAKSRHQAVADLARGVEGVANGGAHTEEALSRSSRFEPLHLALSSPYRLIRILGAIRGAREGPGPSAGRLERDRASTLSLGVTGCYSSDRILKFHWHRNTKSVELTRLTSGPGSTW